MPKFQRLGWTFLAAAAAGVGSFDCSGIVACDPLNRPLTGSKT